MNGFHFLFLFFLVSCDYFIPTQPQTNSAGTATQNVVTITTPSGTTSSGQSNPWGIVKCNHESEAQAFDTQVKRFLSTKQDTNQLPVIGCMKHHKNAGRVFFKGSVVFEGGAVLNPSNPSSSLKVNPQNSFIEVHVDTATEEQRKNNIKPQITVGAIPLSAASPVAGEVSGKQAVLNFKDPSGEVRLEGEIQGVQGEIFTGRFIYKNNRTWKNPSEGFQGTLGVFTIRTCEFFKCS